MARKVYFVFHYQRDIMRVNVVRNSDITKKDREMAGFYDKSLWEEAQKKSELALKRLINGGLDGSSVTAVLIGYETYSRLWVRYEIVKSFDKDNGQLGIYIHQIVDARKVNEPSKGIDLEGKNPFEYLMLSIDSNGKSKYYEWKDSKWVLFDKYPDCSKSFDSKYWGKNYQFSEWYSIYDWIDDDGYKNFGDWVEKAAKQVGR